MNSFYFNGRVIRYVIVDGQSFTHSGDVCALLGIPDNAASPEEALQRFAALPSAKRNVFKRVQRAAVQHAAMMARAN